MKIDFRRKCKKTVKTIFFLSWKSFEFLKKTAIILHATSSTESRLLALPARLDATHQYTPESCSFLLCTARRKNRLPSGNTILQKRKISAMEFQLYRVHIARLPPFGPIEGHEWFDQISIQWESQKNWFAFVSFGKIQFLPTSLRPPVHVVPSLYHNLIEFFGRKKKR